MDNTVLAFIVIGILVAIILMMVATRNSADWGE